MSIQKSSPNLLLITQFCKNVCKTKAVAISVPYFSSLVKWETNKPSLS